MERYKKIVLGIYSLIAILAVLALFTGNSGSLSALGFPLLIINLPFMMITSMITKFLRDIPIVHSFVSGDSLFVFVNILFDILIIFLVFYFIDLRRKNKLLQGVQK